MCRSIRYLPQSSETVSYRGGPSSGWAQRRNVGALPTAGAMASPPPEPTPSPPACGQPWLSGSSWPVSSAVGRCVPSLWRWLGRGLERPSRRLRVRQLDHGGGDHGPRHRARLLLGFAGCAGLASPRVMSVQPSLVRPCCPLQLPALPHSHGIPSGHGEPGLTLIARDPGSRTTRSDDTN